MRAHQLAIGWTPLKLVSCSALCATKRAGETGGARRAGSSGETRRPDCSRLLAAALCRHQYSSAARNTVPQCDTVRHSATQCDTVRHSATQSRGDDMVGLCPPR